MSYLPKKINDLWTLRDVIVYIVRTRNDRDLYRWASVLERHEVPDDIREEYAKKVIEKVESYGYEVSEKLKEKLKRAVLPPLLYYPSWYTEELMRR